MNKLVFALIVIFSLTSCYNTNNSKPDEPEIFLSRLQMVEIMTEVQLIEASFNIKNNRSNADELKPKYYEKILKQYGITIQQLKDNIDYYNNYPKIMEEIYESVLANLSKIQSKVQLEIEEIEKIRIADSIAKITDSLNLIMNDSLKMTNGVK